MQKGSGRAGDPPGHGLAAFLAFGLLATNGVSRRRLRMNPGAALRRCGFH